MRGLVSAFQSASRYGKQARENAHPLISLTDRLALQQILHCPSRADTPIMHPCCRKGSCASCVRLRSPVPYPVRSVTADPVPSRAAGRRPFPAHHLSIAVTTQTPPCRGQRLQAAAGAPSSSRMSPPPTHTPPLGSATSPPLPERRRGAVRPGGGVSCGELLGDGHQPRQVLWQFWVSSGPDPSFLP